MSKAAIDKADALARVVTLLGQGKTVSQACNAEGITLSEYYRSRKKYDPAVGVLSLNADYAKCGGKREHVMTEAEVKAVQTIYLQTRSYITAFRRFADTPECSQELAHCILRRRRWKTVPKSMMDAVRLPKGYLDYYNSPKNYRTNRVTSPTSPHILDPVLGKRRIQPGDISVRDDMSNNFLFWCHWEFGGDPCSNRWGKRLVRGQALTRMDEASDYFQSFSLVARLRDSYRANDIWAWVHADYAHDFIPVVGEQRERGIWESKLLRGEQIEEGHTPWAEREGALASLGRRIFTAYSPKSKRIERRFDFLQDMEGVVPGQIGRFRGEMGYNGKLWMETQRGLHDPSKCGWPSMEQACDWMGEAMKRCNYEPMKGRFLSGSPAQNYLEGIAARAETIKPLAREQAYLFSRDRAKSQVRQGVVRVRYSTADRRRPCWVFACRDLHHLEEEDVLVYYDRICPAEGAVIVPTRPGCLRRGQPTLLELIDEPVKFRLGHEHHFDDPGQREIERRKAQMDAVRSEIRILRPGHLPALRISNVRDGAGASATIEQRNSPIQEKPARGRKAADEESTRGLSRSSRRTAPLSSDTDYMRRLEDQYREANPGLVIN